MAEHLLVKQTPVWVNTEGIPYQGIIQGKEEGAGDRHPASFYSSEVDS